ncbi:MAG: response regulator transcription factor, partial [Caulobacteraceae bacterium]
MAQQKTILIIDDDDELRGALREQLELHQEFAAVEASTAAEGLQMGKEAKADLILLDVDLPDMDGREACRLMRKAGVATPVIMLTGAASDSDTILGLDAGANDYVTKPFRFAVLLARIRAQLRSHETSEDAVFRIGPYEFRPAAKALIDR